MDQQEIRCIDVLAPLEKMLRISGIWPLKHMTFKYKLRTAISWLFSYVFLASMIAEVIHVKGDVEKINEVLCVLTPICGCGSKQVSLIYYKKNFFNILKILKSDTFNKGNANMIQKIMTLTKRGKKIFHGLTFGTLVLYSVIPLFDQKDYPIPFSFNVGRYKCAVYLFQVASLAIVAWNLTTIDLLFVDLLALGTGLANNLGKKLSNIVGGKKECNDYCKISAKLNVEEIMNKVSLKSLRECIKLHISILRYINDIEAVFSFSVIVHYMTATLLLCSSLLQITTMVDIHSTQFIRCSWLAVNALLQSFLYHWFGNEIIVRTDKISEACYSSSWYKCNVELRKMLLIVMTASRKPVGVTIYKFTELSLVSFVTMLRWAYSFTALVRARYVPD
uniref:Odorant receptor n=1 Tax=Protaetia brevitarsis TaxID=348688 RepID=A0A411HRB7_PROBE|nr:odorant receptor [Protaetia brevitarsis]